MSFFFRLLSHSENSLTLNVWFENWLSASRFVVFRLARSRGFVCPQFYRANSRIVQEVCQHSQSQNTQKENLIFDSGPRQAESQRPVVTSGLLEWYCAMPVMLEPIDR
jgi:hypothetical protein